MKLTIVDKQVMILISNELFFSCYSFLIQKWYSYWNDKFMRSIQFFIILTILDYVHRLKCFCLPLVQFSSLTFWLPFSLWQSLFLLLFTLLVFPHACKICSELQRFLESWKSALMTVKTPSKWGIIDIIIKNCTF